MNVLFYGIIFVIILVPTLQGVRGDFEKEFEYHDNFGVKVGKYSLDGGDIIKIKKLQNTCSVTIHLNPNSNGVLEINVLPSIPESRMDRGDVDYDDFLVFVDGKKSDYKETVDFETRTMFIPLNSSSWIEIVGVVPPNIPSSTVCDIIHIFDEYEVIFSPKIQLENGILPENILCEDDLHQAYKKSNNAPICLKLDTMTKLVERNIVSKTMTYSETDSTDEIWVSSFPKQCENVWDHYIVSHRPQNITFASAETQKQYHFRITDLILQFYKENGLNIVEHKRGAISMDDTYCSTSCICHTGDIYKMKIKKSDFDLAKNIGGFEIIIRK